MKNKISILILLYSFTFFGQQLKSPSEFLGYKLGSKFTRHHKVVDYFKYLAENSKSIVFKEYGKTNEDRSLNIAFISSPKNLFNLENIRKQHLSNAGLENVENLDDNAIVWLSYNVHGNEASSTEASMLTAYKLISKKQNWLKNTVVIIDPCLNPDGRDRYVNWYNQVKNKNYNTKSIAREHNEPWPGGRANHYLFDLNRDWAWATQIETKQRLKKYNKWIPHIHVDFHEQGINDPYYFSPAAEPFHEIVTNFQRDFQQTLGKNHAKYFDKNGWLYFTKERFDLLYPSYGDTYPMFNGAIGLTHEQAGNGRAGLGIETDEKEILTLTDRLLHHTTTGLSTVETASKNVLKLNQEFRKYFKNQNFKYKSYVLKGNISKQTQLINLLEKHEIKFGYAKPQTVSGFNYNQNKKSSFKASNKDLVISTNQPKGLLIKALFEPKTMIKDSLTYDITAWSLPYAYGFNTIASKKLIDASKENKNSINTTIKDKPYAYIFDWNHISDAKLLSDLLHEKINVRFNEKYIENSGQKLQPGSLIVTKRDNKHIKQFDTLIYKIVKKNKKPNKTISTGFASVGLDIGSPNVKKIKNQKIAILSGKNISSLNFGEIQYFLEKDISFEYTAIDTNDFYLNKLNEFNILILPNGYYNSKFGGEQLKKLNSWIKAGGKIIAIGNANAVFAKSKEFSLSLKKKEDKKKENAFNVDTEANLIPYANSEREKIKNYITGAVFKTKVDNTHPLAFGYEKEYFTLRLNEKSFYFLKKGDNVVRIEDNTIISGFAGSKTINKQKESLVFGVDNIGKGSIIYMIDNPLIRGFWDNGKLFFANAIFMTNIN